MTKNILEAIVLPVTSREIDNGYFERFIKQLQKIDHNELSFVIMINNIEHTNDIIPLIKSIEPKFKSVEVVYANITKEDDIYTSELLKDMPEYGMVSGPNILFLGCMDYCKKFNTTLLLETDCFLKKSFIHELEMFTKYSGGFLVAGSTYDGMTKIMPPNNDFYHLNGVALYKTGDHVFQHVLEQLSTFIIESVKDDPYLAYDIAMTRMVFRNINLEKHGGDNWKRVFKQFIKTNLFVNLSPMRDMNYLNINDKFPDAVVIHKKFTDTDVHFLREFLIQDLDQ
jgi:hypothetical protein